jgi:hypothetical protein
VGQRLELGAPVGAGQGLEWVHVGLDPCPARLRGSLMCTCGSRFWEQVLGAGLGHRKGQWVEVLYRSTLRQCCCLNWRVPCGGWCPGTGSWEWREQA